MQIGGGGSQTASDSAGTAQVAMPGLSGDGALTRDLAGSSAGAAVTPYGGDQLADGSAGTVQVGGNGSQTASDSVGTGQVALPGATAGGTTSDAGGSVTPTGGSQTADDSIGTVQVGGGGGGAATTTSPPGPTSGVAGVTASTPSPSQTEVPAAVPDATASVDDPDGTAAPLGRESSNPLTPLGVATALPFTGIALGAIVLSGLVLLLLGLALRTRTAGATA
jgi:hypothetical protein